MGGEISAFGILEQKAVCVLVPLLLPPCHACSRFLVSVPVMDWGVNCLGQQFMWQERVHPRVFPLPPILQQDASATVCCREGEGQIWSFSAWINLFDQ